MRIENVILVNAQNEELGTMEKLEAHRKGLLHRAFSIYLFNDNNQLLLQKRASQKYHSGGLWTNTCCGHPRPTEKVETAAKRRLKEEMGLSSELVPVSTFTYKVDLDQGMIEHEYLHVFVGKVDTSPEANPLEVEDWKFVEVSNTIKEMETSPALFTEWFKLTLPTLKLDFTKWI